MLGNVFGCETRIREGEVDKFTSLVDADHEEVFI